MFLPMIHCTTSELMFNAAVYETRAMVARMLRDNTFELLMED